MQFITSLLFIFIFQTYLFCFDLQKPKTYNNYHNITNWLMSEKLDGIRAYWNGKNLISKNGNIINAPLWFIKDFPNFPLDGELWTKRNDFENIQSIVLDKTPSKQWSEITYNIFEVPFENPMQKGNFFKRLKKIQNWQEKNNNQYIKIIEQIRCKSKEHLDKYLNELVKKKAEGIIIKNPFVDYFTGRSSNILKVKKFDDMEGEVIGINYNKEGTFKSLVLKLENGIIFNLGNGFNKEQKGNHPKIKDIVTFKYYSFTKYGKPKFASFLRVRKAE